MIDRLLKTLGAVLSRLLKGRRRANSMPREPWPPPLKFDGAAADQLSAVVSAYRERTNLTDAEVEWGVRMSRAYADVPPITTAKQYRDYQRRAAGMLRAAFGPGAHTPDAFNAFIRTADGAAAAAMMTRVSEWEKRNAGPQI
jgi:hypothetical protein